VSTLIRSFLSRPAQLAAVRGARRFPHGCALLRFQQNGESLSLHAFKNYLAEGVH